MMLFVIFVIVVSALISFLKPKKHFKRNDTNIYNNIDLRTEFAKKFNYEITEIMNNGEMISAYVIKNFLEEYHIPLSLLAQVPLHSFVKQLNPNEPELHRGLVVDFVLMNNKRKPFAIIEIDGNGHNTKYDELKNTICVKAGIAVLRVDTHTNYTDFKSYQNFVRAKVYEKLSMHFNVPKERPFGTYYKPSDTTKRFTCV